MAFLLSYRAPKSTFHRVFNERRRSISSSIQRHDKRPTHLLTYSTIPEWHQDNLFIISGYRPSDGSTWSCIQSIFSIHNETVNIWTHLLPAISSILFQLVFQLLLSLTYPDATLLDRFVFSANILAASICFTLSTSYHSLMCHSQSMSALWLRIDYIGILTLILGSFFSGIYVGFYCNPLLRNTYWSMITSLSLTTSLLVLHPSLQGLQYRSLRTSAFIATGLSGFFPILHGIYLYGWSLMLVRSGMPYYFLEGAVYGLGAVFFALRIPESVWPGRFDIWGGSHQIFHVLVVVASMVHLYGVWDAFGWNYRNQRVCAVSY